MKEKWNKFVDYINNNKGVRVFSLIIFIAIIISGSLGAAYIGDLNSKSLKKSIKLETLNEVISCLNEQYITEIGISKCKDTLESDINSKADEETKVLNIIFKAIAICLTSLITSVMVAYIFLRLKMKPFDLKSLRGIIKYLGFIGPVITVSLGLYLIALIYLSDFNFDVLNYNYNVFILALTALCALLVAILDVEFRKRFEVSIIAGSFPITAKKKLLNQLVISRRKLNNQLGVVDIYSIGMDIDTSISLNSLYGNLKKDKFIDKARKIISSQIVILDELYSFNSDKKQNGKLVKSEQEYIENSRQRWNYISINLHKNSIDLSIKLIGESMYKDIDFVENVFKKNKNSKCKKKWSSFN